MHKALEIITRLWILPALPIGVLLVLALSTPATHAEEADSVYENLKVFSDVLGKVQDHYVEDVDNEQLIHGAIRGMLETLDPHSVFLDKDMFEEMKVDTEGKFGGLGIEITMEDGILRIITPIDDTPAFRVGLKAGDRIVKIDGEETRNMTIMQAVDRMRGEPGTDVTLSIFRKGFEELKDFTITRDIIHIQSVKSRMLDAGYGYVRLTNFQKGTGKEVRDAIAALESEAPDKHLDGLVLDLRNNPGGLLDSAVEVSDIFVREGMIVSTHGRMPGSDSEYRATRLGYEDLPLVVLVNGGSASASEIVAGAIQDHRQGIILGTPTFGKASVQHIIPLEDESAIKLTIAFYYTPSGRLIQTKGIEPDIVLAEDEWIPNPDAHGDNAMREKDLKGHLDNKDAPEGTEDLPELETPEQRDKRDVQLQRALEILRGLTLMQKREAATLP